MTVARSCWAIVCCGLIASAYPAYGQATKPNNREHLTAFRDVAKRVLPAVVSIKPAERSNRSASKLRQLLEGGMAPGEAAQLFRELENDKSEDNGGFGSGVIVDPNGVILTNNHVVGNADKVEVQLNDGRRFMSKEISRDPKTDLAIIRLDPQEAPNLTAAQLGDSNQLEIGDWILAMGAPFGLRGSVTAGIISAKSRPLDVAVYEDFIQTDAAINPGNSGGPLVDLDGNVVGINTAIRSGTGTYAGVAFAIPSNMAKVVVNDLVRYGKVKRCFIGVTMDEAKIADLKRLGITNGVVVTKLYDGDSPAQKAGLQVRDIIQSIDGKPIHTPKDLQEVVTYSPAGKEIKLSIIRDGKKSSLPVILEAQPEEYGIEDRRRPRNASPRLETRDELRFPELGFQVAETNNGLMITQVFGNSPAATANLTPRCFILEVERKPVNTLDDLRQIERRSNDGMLLRVRFPNNEERLVVIK